MTPFEQHMRKYHPDSTTARLSREVELLRSFPGATRNAPQQKPLGVRLEYNTAKYGTDWVRITPNDDGSENVEPFAGSVGDVLMDFFAGLKPQE